VLLKSAAGVLQYSTTGVNECATGMAAKVADECQVKAKAVLPVYRFDYTTGENDRSSRQSYLLETYARAIW